MSDSEMAQETFSVRKSKNFVEGSLWLSRLKKLEQTAREFMSDPKYTDEEKTQVQKELLAFFHAGELAIEWKGHPVTSVPTPTDCSRLPIIPVETNAELDNSKILLPSNRKKESDENK